MRTTIEIPDALFRQAKSRAALEGILLRELIERALRDALAGRGLVAGRRVALPLHRSAHPGALTSRAVRDAEARAARDEDAAHARSR